MSFRQEGEWSRSMREERRAARATVLRLRTRQVMRRIAKNRLESSRKRRTDTMTRPVPTRESDALPATINLWSHGKESRDEEL